MSTGRVGHFAGWGNQSITPTSCFSDDVWDPFYPFPSIQAEALDGAGFEWKETAEAHSLTGRLRGVKKEEVKVEVEGGGRVLKISGKRSCAEEFLQRFRLPENVKAEEMKAAMKEDGVLTVTVPKGEVKVHEVKVVQIVYC